MKKHCLKCQTQFKTYLSQIKKGKGKYCSKSCYWKSKKGKSTYINQITKKGMKLNTGRTHFRKGNTPWNKGKKGLQIAWNKNPNKVENSTLARKRAMGQIDYILWRTAVFMRDDYTCQECGQRGGRLEADHIKPWALYPELRYAIDNGRTFCRSCHMLTDTWGGKLSKLMKERMVA